MFWNIDIKNGNVAYDDISFINEDVDLHEYIDYLKEDMLQIEFEDNILLDVGWRPSFEIDGKFYVSLIKNFDWENPIAIESIKSIKDLKLCINKIVLKYTGTE
jgi:hypothetical protein